MWGYELGRTARDLGVAVLIGAIFPELIMLTLKNSELTVKGEK